MYLPGHFREHRVAPLQRLIRERPLASVVTVEGGTSFVDHLPLCLCTGSSRLGLLQGHVAKANPLWRRQPAGTEVLAVFHGPEAYISPSWYPTKAEHGKAVPTWNYVAVHAYGRIQAKEDESWISRHLAELTATHEAAFDPPWRISDAPESFIGQLLGAVVGIEIEITRLVGKWKASQNQPPSNREGVWRGLIATGQPACGEMAAIVKDSGGCGAATGEKAAGPEQVARGDGHAG